MSQMDQQNENTQPTPAWGDAVMPVAGAERQEQMRRLEQASAEHAGGAHPTPQGVPQGGGPANNPLLDVAGRPASPVESSAPPYTTPLPQTDTIEGNWAPLLGPSSEAMADGSSPAPRGYTGGAMGRYLAGLSPSFSAAASGAPPTSPPPASTPAPRNPATQTGAEQPPLGSSGSSGSSGSADPGTSRH